MHASKNGRYDQLLVTMSVSEIIYEDGAKQNFSVPPLVTVSVEPYRMVIPLNEKYALTRNGSAVEFEVTGTLGALKATLLRVEERQDCELKNFIEAVLSEKK